MFSAINGPAQQISSETNNTLDLYAYPPIYKINWKNPRSALLSLVMSGLKKKFSQNQLNEYTSLVGHAMVHIRCQDTAGRNQDQWVGLTGQNKKEVDDKLVYDDQVGLGVLFYEYVDGSIDKPERSRFEITNYKGRHDFFFRQVKPEFLRTPLTTAACDRVVKMAADLRSISWDGQATLEQLQKRQPGDVLHFGFTFDPYNDYLNWVQSGHKTKLGGGCASMAAAFLKMSGNFLSAFQDRWTQDIDVGESRIGEADAPKGSDKRVSILSLLFAMGSAWKKEGETTRKLFFYDPEKMWSYMRGVRLCVEQRQCTDQSQTDVQELTNRGLNLQGARETFDQVRRYWIPVRDSKGAYHNSEPRPVPYEVQVTRKGFQVSR